MWVFTAKGFYSAVQHRADPTKLMIRARVKEDIEALVEEFFPGTEIVQKDKSDYEYRITVPAAEWATALAQMALDVDYDNFKNAVHDEQGFERSQVYMGVWSKLLALEPASRSQQKWATSSWPSTGDRVETKKGKKTGTVESVTKKGVNVLLDGEGKTRWFHDKDVRVIHYGKGKYPDAIESPMDLLLHDRVRAVGTWHNGEVGTVVGFSDPDGIYVRLDADPETQASRYFYYYELTLDEPTGDGGGGSQTTLSTHFDATSGSENTTLQLEPPKPKANGKKKSKGPSKQAKPGGRKRS